MIFILEIVASVQYVSLLGVKVGFDYACGIWYCLWSGTDGSTQGSKNVGLAINERAKCVPEAMNWCMKVGSTGWW